ncbi:hypothetical protein ACFV2U_46525 [Streptomyces sp. NPDC059697]|uniref:hypothetical protein n=1 Tax=Streptomyces sp. NPDC059697 TaxID=3346912 RepID=UPI003682EF54
MTGRQRRAWESGEGKVDEERESHRNEADGDEMRQDPYVERFRPDPATPPQRVITLLGLLGNSDREGYKRLYFSRKLDQYAEFKAEDVVATEPIPADRQPFIGLDATSVSITRDASVEYTWATTGQPGDEFDLDVRLGSPGMASAVHPLTITPPDNTNDPSCGGICPTQYGWNTCHTCHGCPTNTCNTQCQQGTCQTCNTCQTQCQQNTCPTCDTCQTQCDQATCRTCLTLCGQWACQPHTSPQVYCVPFHDTVLTLCDQMACHQTSPLVHCIPRTVVGC